jgi:hypothetical protein
MIKFLAKLAIFCLIPFIAISVFVAVTPLDLYTYRSWEALTPFLLPRNRPFYPNQHLEMVEVGELGVRTEYEVEKHTEFITDHYGQRYAEPPLARYDIIIIGDSNIVGSGVDQEDTIAAVLSKESGLAVYPFYRSINGFLNSEFTATKPKLIILMSIEREVDSELCPNSLPAAWPSPDKQSPPVGIFTAQILLDRLLREGYYSTQYFRSQRAERHIIVNDSTRMLFFNTSLAPPDNSPETNQETIDALARCSQWFEEQGIQFIFIPIPDKENVYFDHIPESNRPELDVPRDRFYKEILAGLENNQVPAIDLFTAFLSARNEGITPYQLDDTHWSAAGIRLAVEQILVNINCVNSECNLGE